MCANNKVPRKKDLFHSFSIRCLSIPFQYCFILYTCSKNDNNFLYIFDHVARSSGCTDKLHAIIEILSIYYHGLTPFIIIIGIIRDGISSHLTLLQPRVTSIHPINFYLSTPSNSSCPSTFPREQYLLMVQWLTIFFFWLPFMTLAPFYCLPRRTRIRCKKNVFFSLLPFHQQHSVSGIY